MLTAEYQICGKVLVWLPAPDLDGEGAWGPDVVGGPMCRYRMFR